jgi:hypothetical protein
MLYFGGQLAPRTAPKTLLNLGSDAYPDRTVMAPISAEGKFSLILVSVVLIFLLVVSLVLVYLARMMHSFVINVSRSHARDGDPPRDNSMPVNLMMDTRQRYNSGPPLPPTPERYDSGPPLPPLPPGQLPPERGGRAYATGNLRMLT